MNEKGELLAIYINKKGHLSTKGDKNSKKINIGQKTEFALEFTRNDFSYIIEALIDILRILIDIFYKNLNLLICIDGHFEYFTKNSITYNNLIAFLSKKFEPIDFDLNIFFERLARISISHSKISSIIIFPFSSANILHLSFQKPPGIDNDFLINILYLYNTSKLFSISQKDCPEITFINDFQFRNQNLEFLSMDLINDITSIFEIKIINIGNITTEGPATQFSNDTNIAIRCSDEIVPNRLMFAISQNHQFDSFVCSWFSLISFIDNDKMSTKSLMGFLKKGHHAYLCDYNKPDCPIFTIFKHGEMYYFHKIQPLIDPSLIQPKISEMPQNKSDFPLKEFSSLIKTCRLLPEASESQNQLTDCIKNLRRKFLFFSPLKMESSVMCIENIKQLFDIVSQPNFKDSEYVTCEKVVQELFDCGCMVILPGSKDVKIEQYDILEALNKIAFAFCDVSSNHLKLFGFIRKTMFWSDTKPRYRTNISRIFPNKKSKSYSLQKIFKDNKKYNPSLFDIYNKFQEKIFDQSNLIPFGSELDPSLTLYKGVKLSSVNEVKNEAFDL